MLFGRISSCISSSTWRSRAEPDTPSGPSRAVQIHHRYLVAASDDGVEVIDQHALHERILYEQLRKKMATGRVEIQRLLTPETIHLSPAECAAITEHQSLLAEVGFHVEPFGGSTILVTALPALV